MCLLNTVIIRFSALCAYLKMRFLECVLIRGCALISKNCGKGCALISKAGQRSNTQVLITKYKQLLNR